MGASAPRINANPLSSGMEIRLWSGSSGRSKDFQSSATDLLHRRRGKCAGCLPWEREQIPMVKELTRMHCILSYAYENKGDSHARS